MKITDVGAALDPQFEKVDTPKTDAFEKWYFEWGNHVDEVFVFARQLECELAEAQAEIVRLNGEAESWEKVFDRTCEHLADAKEQLRLCNIDQFTTAAELADAVAKERERCALVCDKQTQGKSMWIEGARACATAIRKGE